MFRRIVLAAAAMTLFVMGPAQAHTDLVSSDPADGARLSSAPSAITLTFGEDLLTSGDRLVVKASDGADVDLGASEVDGPRLTAAWPAQAGTGTYTVYYRAVAADGHPLEGSITFSIKATPASPVPSVVTTGPPAQTNTAAEPSATNPWVIAGPALLVLVIAAAGVFVWRSRD